MSLRQACRLVQLSLSMFYYRPKRKEENEVVRDRLSELAQLHNRWGFWMMFHHLRNLEYRWNHKRVYRIYTEMKLNLRRKHKRRLPQPPREYLSWPIGPNITWSMDFMHDGTMPGSKFRAFNIIDDFNREGLNLTLDTGINSRRVIRQLDQLITWRGKPEKLRVDNGPEFVAEKLRKWCEARNIELSFIQKGRPSQNAYIERFNRTFREEVLDNFAFDNLNQARRLAQAWLWVYNNERPHSSLKYMTPRQFLLKCGKLGEFSTFQQDSDNDWKSLITGSSVSN